MLETAAAMRAQIQRIDAEGKLEIEMFRATDSAARGEPDAGPGASGQVTVGLILTYLHDFDLATTLPPHSEL